MHQRSVEEVQELHKSINGLVETYCKRNENTSDGNMDTGTFAVTLRVKVRAIPW
jgi:hypothetical protein